MTTCLQCVIDINVAKSFPKYSFASVKEKIVFVNNHCYIMLNNLSPGKYMTQNERIQILEQYVDHYHAALQQIANLCLLGQYDEARKLAHIAQTKPMREQ